MLLDFIRENWWLLFLGILLGSFSIFSRRNRNTNKTYNGKLTDVSSDIAIGSNVTLDSGIHGIVRKIQENTYMVEIANNVIIEVEKYGIVFVR
ncbi:preprotein translocase, YajC subunit [Enterococcus pallens ATCC BAA-351]|uniref:Preprotein translocase, YajC subunit n=2 Tax=Enterococcus pallens TaxID=160454 RepID=R2SK61_9ENTE|nr:preprotein translocase, YajC subunit [Enterococcus pallens ATCC BAA-351]EOU21298.1 preprotein translocase, YajC subunit [Enterococcus pallens ATCC BAA-351]